MSEREERLNRRHARPADPSMAELGEHDRANQRDSWRSEERRLDAAVIGVIALAWTIQFLSFSLDRFLRDPGSGELDHD